MSLPVESFDYAEPDRLRRFIRLAQEHASDFSNDAARYDLQAEYPFDNIDALHDSGYMGLTVPEELGGMGANIEEFATAQFHLGQGCGSTAMAANMHLQAVGRWADRWRREPDDRTEQTLRQVIQDRMVVCAIASDVSTGGDPRYTGAVAKRVEGGYLVSAVYAFATNSVAASNINFMFNAPADDGTIGMYSTSLPKDTEGITVLDDWDPMGMRGSGSNSVKVKDVFVPDEKITRARRPGTMTQITLDAHAWFTPGVMAVILGIAQAALNEGVADTRGRTRKPFDRTMEHFPGAQFGIAEASIELEAAKAYFDKCTRSMSSRTQHTIDDYVECESMKYHCARAAKKVVNDVIEMVGGAAYLRKKPFERRMRDVMSGTFFPQNKYTALELIGKHIFGVDWETEPRFT